MKKVLPVLVCVAVLLFACGQNGTKEEPAQSETTSVSSVASEEAASATESKNAESGEGEGSSVDETKSEETVSSSDASTSTGAETVSLANIPEYTGSAYVAINNNQPFFTETDYTTEAFETYSNLDSLHRCGVAYANICVEIMPTEKRGEIGQVKPSGWHTVKYDCVDGKYLYNRCHLIGFQLAGENANEKNLITGTRYLNIQGMLPFENMAADYVKETEHHVLYRVTPMFSGDNLVADGVLMEGYSVEDNGEGICFCVFAYNVQPGVTIDYATGDSELSDGAAAATEEVTTQAEGNDSDATDSAGEGEMEYVLNTNTYKFHNPSCSSVDRIAQANRKDYTGTRESVIAMGYDPCGRCKP